MGQITIAVEGSFTLRDCRKFTALNHGHADAVAQAIEWLSSEVLPSAIALDHKLDAEGSAPLKGWTRD